MPTRTFQGPNIDIGAIFSAISGGQRANQALSLAERDREERLLEQQRRQQEELAREKALTTALESVQTYLSNPEYQAAGPIAGTRAAGIGALEDRYIGTATSKALRAIQDAPGISEDALRYNFLNSSEGRRLAESSIRNRQILGGAIPITSDLGLPAPPDVRALVEAARTEQRLTPMLDPRTGQPVIDPRTKQPIMIPQATRVPGTIRGLEPFTEEEISAPVGPTLGAEDFLSTDIPPRDITPLDPNAPGLAQSEALRNLFIDLPRDTANSLYRYIIDLISRGGRYRRGQEHIPGPYEGQF